MTSKFEIFSDSLVVLKINTWTWSLFVTLMLVRNRSLYALNTGFFLKRMFQNIILFATTLNDKSDTTPSCPITNEDNEVAQYFPFLFFMHCTLKKLACYLNFPTQSFCYFLKQLHKFCCAKRLFLEALRVKQHT